MTIPESTLNSLISKLNQFNRIKNRIKNNFKVTICNWLIHLKMIILKMIIQMECLLFKLNKLCCLSINQWFKMILIH
jgi:hypothetical protein